MGYTEREKIMEQYNAAQRLMQMNRFEEAAGYLQRCYEQCEQSGDSASCETVLGELAICYQKAEKFDDSVKALYRLLAAVREEGPTQRRAIVHHNLGFLYEMQNDFASAEAQFRQSSEVASEAGDRRGQGLSLAMLAQVLIASNRSEEGFETFVRAIAALHDVNAPEVDHVIDHTKFIATKQHFDGLERVARKKISDEEVLKRLLRP